MSDPHDAIHPSEGESADIDRATGDAPVAPGSPTSDYERIAGALAAAGTERGELPAHLRGRLITAGEAAMRDGRSHSGPGERSLRLAFVPWALAAAALVALGAGLWWSVGALQQRDSDLKTLRERNAALAEQLAAITSDLDAARAEIVMLTEPIDPAVLAERRRELLDLPDTTRLAWQPFDLPDDPALQRGQVGGDVVWNDELDEGYLRFVGLRPNDPEVEQYQVWLIDERGMEQKVSGGVFNASDSGEIIVPIEPGIEVGRVKLFAITVEDPGGIWVPDLKRRVVIAPREDG